jgi:protease IV
MSEQPRSRVLLWVLIGGGAFFLFLLAVFTLVYFSVRSQDKSEFGSGFGDKIAVVDVTGVILDPKETVKQIKKYGDDSSIKAIVIHLNTPGGGAAARATTVRSRR